MWPHCHPLKLAVYACVAALLIAGLSYTQVTRHKETGATRADDATNSSERRISDARLDDPMHRSPLPDPLGPEFRLEPDQTESRPTDTPSDAIEIDPDDRYSELIKELEAAWEEGDVDTAAQISFLSEQCVGAEVGHYKEQLQAELDHATDPGDISNLQEKLKTQTRFADFCDLDDDAHVQYVERQYRWLWRAADQGHEWARRRAIESWPNPLYLKQEDSRKEEYEQRRMEYFKEFREASLRRTEEFAYLYAYNELRSDGDPAEQTRAMLSSGLPTPHEEARAVELADDELLGRCE